MNRWFKIGWLLAIQALVGCGTPLPPQELLQARSAYNAASKSAAVQLAPAQLDTAKQALEKAEASFKEDGDDQSTKDIAYIASVRAQIAVAEAGREQAVRNKAKIDHDFRNSQLDALDSSKSQLEQEKAARANAEKARLAAEASLKELANVKEESRGVVITLSGSVLFATGKSTLLPIAQNKLAEVAKALSDQGYKSLLVEGHTDSQGSIDKNMALSQERAQAVRSYLVSQGIPSDKIRAEGIGSGRPVADNSTAEGRANNRRVEIVVEPEHRK
jgi:outer membrane protein OmpA-like peptidoglycan-associated protein